ncbi:MAG: hypothetical protein A2474_04185 [Elusimicrobia bacterium RIFOXYC2_FULL_34_12]|nr:MAG: hypothetical protein A2474_04185 [Elusimicrobia bacterium RIFOXYC2_FULL_34_12]OGS38695.1 MAG: hypothetical protein A2551_01810 [Elusimicrobia bacterium RIFOXYD2_FULL_34_30]HAM39411.1 hypothetical protein [Elusimicrobiota bacterium]
MINILIITHEDFGATLLKTAQNIMGEQEFSVAISVANNEDPGTVEIRLEKIIQSLKIKNGLLILLDLVGGTPSIICTSLLKRFNEKVEILSGVNLYMVLSAFTHRQKLTLLELKEKVLSDAKASIMDLKGNFFRV